MFKKIFKLFVVLMISLLLVGCGAAGPSGTPDVNDNLGSNEGIVIETNRKIYYTVDMNINTDDVNETMQYYTQEAIKLEGYISNSNIATSGVSYVTYRIPTASLTEFLNHIDNDSNSEVTRKSISTSDITTKYNKVEARLEILYASRQSYVKLLEKANSLSEIISLQNKIEDIDTEILQLENEKGSYDNLIDYSTIKIYFNTKEKKNNFFTEYLQYFVNFFKVIGIIILYTIPFGIIGFLILGIIVICRRNKKKRKEVINNEKN